MVEERDKPRGPGVYSRKWLMLVEGSSEMGSTQMRLNSHGNDGNRMTAQVLDNYYGSKAICTVGASVGQNEYFNRK